VQQLAIGVKIQAPVVGLHVSVVQGLLSLQTVCVPPLHCPPVQVVFEVHALPSSQAVPFATFRQLPLAGLTS
jgi:hypothetical protein